MQEDTAGNTKTEKEAKSIKNCLCWMIQGKPVLPGRSICLVWIDLFKLHCRKLSGNKDEIF